MFVVVGIALGVFEEFAQQRDDQAVAKGEAGLQDVDEILRVRVFLLTEGTLQAGLVQEAVAGKFLGAVDRDGVGNVDQVAAKGLAANQPLYQRRCATASRWATSMFAQEPKQGIGMRQGLQLGEQQLADWPRTAGGSARG